MSDGSKQPSLAVRAVGSSAWTAGGQVAQILLGLVLFGVLARWLTPSDYGLIGMASTVTGILGIMGDGGVAWALTRQPKIDHTLESTGFWLSLLGAAVFTLISLAAAPILAAFFRTPAVGSLSAALATMFVLSAPGRVSAAKLSRNLGFRAITLSSLTSNLVGAVAAVLLAARGAGAWALVAQTAVTTGLQAAILLALSPPHVRRRDFSRVQARELARVGGHVSGYALTTILGRSLDSFLAGRYIGSAAVGYMGMGIRLLFIPMERLSVSASAVFVPTAVELGDRNRQARAFHSATRLLLLLAAPFCAGTIALAPEVVSLLPPKWAGLAPVLRLYALGSIFSPLVHMTFSVIVAHGRSRVLLGVALAVWPVAWAGAVVGTLAGSVLVMAAAWGVSIAVGALAQLYFAWRILGLGRSFWAVLAVPVAVSAAMAVGVRLIVSLAGLGGRPAGFGAGVAAGVLIYAVLTWLTMRADILRISDLLAKAAGGPRRPPTP